MHFSQPERELQKWATCYRRRKIDDRQIGGRTAATNRKGAICMSLEPVSVRVQSFAQMMSPGHWPLSVDTYQRGFVWRAEKMRQLLDDLREYSRTVDAMLPYYMGSILLHRSSDKQRRFVIDGQQRLTALSVLHHHLTRTVPDNCALSFSPQSESCIREAAKACADWHGTLDVSIFDRIVFTEISVDDVDLAFTFFDTQNNRGVPLHATDLLKAYHLRAINGESEARKLNLQTQCASRWEDLQREELPLTHRQELVQSLFSRYLWRARRWTGQQTNEGSHALLLIEFQEASLRAKNAINTIPLYASRSNRRALALSLTAQGESELHAAPIALNPKAADLPLAIRQPIHRGIGFFLYADKYAALLRWLTLEPTDSAQLLSFRKVFDTMVRATSLYLRENFLLASLVYIDQFNEEQLWEFSLWLEHALGAVRIEKQQVRQETAQKFFRDDPVKNLLDVIVGAFTPDEVIRHLRARSDEAYEAERIDVVAGGVQSIYKRVALAYFDQKADSLSDKRRWIQAQLDEVTP